MLVVNESVIRLQTMSYLLVCGFSIYLLIYVFRGWGEILEWQEPGLCDVKGLIFLSIKILISVMLSKLPVLVSGIHNTFIKITAQS